MESETMTLDSKECRNPRGAKPCLCGSNNIVAICYGYNYPARRVEEWIVACDDCCHETDDEPTLEQAIQRWNR